MGNSNYSSKVTFFNSGYVESGINDEDFDITFCKRKYTLRKGSNVTFYESGKVKSTYIKNDFEINLNNINLFIREGDFFNLYENCNLKEISSYENLTLYLNKVEYTFASGFPLIFYDDGFFLSGLLSKPSTTNIQGIDMNIYNIQNGGIPDSYLITTFYKSGKIKSFSPNESVKIQYNNSPYYVYPNHRINLDEDGNITEITDAYDL